MPKRRRSEDGSEEGSGTPERKKFRADRWSVPAELNHKVELCHKLYDHVRKYKDENNRVLCEFLIRAPSRRTHPEYYNVVTSPIDLMKIQQKLRTDDYRTVQSFLNDLRLLLENVWAFHSRGSEECRTALTLERVLLQKLEEVSGRVSEESSDTTSPPSLTLKISKEQLLASRPGRQTRMRSSHTDETAGLPVSPSNSSSYTTSLRASTSASGGGKLAIKAKLTRSKAWLEGYLASEDPIKIFVAAVYNYHDPLGEFVAEPFHELPSRKDYPGYYRIIVEPIDLNTIKKKVEEGRYINLKHIQDDMILMIKNAHYFNEPGSEIYKLASFLRKFIVSKCLELERRFQTVTKTQPLKVSLKRLSVSGGEEEQPKTPKLTLRLSGGEETMARRASRSFSLSEISDSESESSEDDFSGEGEGEEGETESGGGKLLLRIKKEKKKQTDIAGMDPVTKLLKAKKLPSLKRRQTAVYQAVVTKTDNTSRLLSDLFMKRPSAKVYPEYYLVIPEPVDLREIRRSIRTQKYSTMEELMSNIELMSNNACTFNEEGSQVYNDAVTLKQVAQDAHHRLQQGWQEQASPTTAVPAGRGPGRPRGKSGSASSPLPTGGGGAVGGAIEVTPARKLLNAVKGARAPPGRLLWLTFRQLPPSATIPDYHSAIKKPIDFLSIDTRLQSGQYPGLDALFQDLTLLCDNACRYHDEDTQPYKDAVLLHRTSVSKYMELTASERERRLKAMPDVQEHVWRLLQEIASKTVNAKAQRGGGGRGLVDSLQGIAVTQEILFNEEDSPSPGRRTLTLGRVEQWACQGRYSRLEQLQSDLLSLLREARESSAIDSQMYSDSVAMERHYLTIRDQVCRNGELLWSPALSHTIRELDMELSAHFAARAKTSSPTPSSPSSSPSSSSSSSSSHSDSEEGESATPERQQLPDEKSVLPDGSSREYFQDVEQGGVVYRVGDIAYLEASKPGKKPYIVLLERFWKDSSDNMWLEGCWFYRPEETFHLATRKFYEKEVFKSDFHGLARLPQLAGKCYVMFIKDYPKFLPEEVAEEDVYVCESRYAYRAKTFKRIKVWNLLLEPQSTLVPRASPLVLTRVPSVFAEQATSSGIKGGWQGQGPVLELDKNRSGGDGMQTGGKRNVKLESDPRHEMETEEEDMETLGEGDDDTSKDILEMSFYENFQNVEAPSVPNPEAGCTYFEQYCIDENKFRVGDFVYVRSDEDIPFIARIEKMWTDENDDPWFRGPWFVRSSEVEHLPTRMFLEKELFLSNIQDTNPMRSIIGKCAVLFITDYYRKRPTEYLEEDVFVVESRYNESDKELRKMKGLKSFPVSNTVAADEIYFFSQEIQPLKVPSPHLFPKHGSQDVILLPPPPPPPHIQPPRALQDPLGRSTLPLPLSSSSSSAAHRGPAVAPLLPQNPGSTVFTPTGMTIPRGPSGEPSSQIQAKAAATLLKLNPQLLESLLSAKQLSSTKPVIIPLQQPPIATSTTSAPSQAPSLLPQAPTTPSSSSECMCRWDGCGKAFENSSALTNHLLFAGVGGHVNREVDGMFYCKWNPCPRNPRLGGKPFDALPKLTRHLKEVHLMKLSQSPLGLSPRNHSMNYQQALAYSDIPNSVHVPPSPLSSATSSSHPLAIAITPNSTPLAPAHVPTPVPIQLTPTFASPATVARVPSTTVSTSTIQPVVITSSAPKSSETLISKPPEVPSIFHAPPEDRRHLVHSDIYLNYIRGLRTNSVYMSSFESSQTVRENHLSHPPKPIRASDWLSPEAIQQSDSVGDAIWALRDHMLQDSMALARYLDNIQ